MHWLRIVCVKNQMLKWQCYIEEKTEEKQLKSEKLKQEVNNVHKLQNCTTRTKYTVLYNFSMLFILLLDGMFNHN